MLNQKRVSGFTLTIARKLDKQVEPQWATP